MKAKKCQTDKRESYEIMTAKQKLELTWIGKDQRPKLAAKDIIGYYDFCNIFQDDHKL